jgi:hypothetical protein
MIPTWVDLVVTLHQTDLILPPEVIPSLDLMNQTEVILLKADPIHKVIILLIQPLEFIRLYLSLNVSKPNNLIHPRITTTTIHPRSTITIHPRRTKTTTRPRRITTTIRQRRTTTTILTKTTHIKTKTKTKTKTTSIMAIKDHNKHISW